MRYPQEHEWPGELESLVATPLRATAVFWLYTKARVCVSVGRMGSGGVTLPHETWQVKSL